MKKFIIVLFVFVFYGITATAQDENQPAPSLQKEKITDELNAEQIIEQNKPALVSIWYNSNDYYSSYYPYSTPKDTTLLSGSGFIFMNCPDSPLKAESIKIFNKNLLGTYLGTQK